MYFQDNASQSQRINNMQMHLTDSIRQAKQKIEANKYQQFPIKQFSTQQNMHTQQNQFRQRASSYKNIGNNANFSTVIGKKEDKNALAEAMRALQQRIKILESEKKQLETRGERRGDKQSLELDHLVNALRQKQHEIKKLNRVNSDLSERQTQLHERIIQLEQELEMYRKNIYNKGGDEVKRTVDLDRDLRIKQLQRQEEGLKLKVQELETRNGVHLQTISKLMRQLQNEKRTNLRWIRLHESQLTQMEEKENSSLQVNREAEAKAKNKINDSLKRESKEIAALRRKNEQMFQSAQRGKQKIAELGRQCKQYQQRYNRLKLIAAEIVEIVNKSMPSPPVHLKYLSLKIAKLQNHHLESLRSLSRNSRKGISERSSNSKDRKRSLKMSDLNSSSKRSQGRSSNKSYARRQEDNTGSAKKPRIEKEKLRADKSEGQLDKPSREVLELEKEVNDLKRQHRNWVTRACKLDIDESERGKLQNLVQEYNDKKEKLDALRGLGM